MRALDGRSEDDFSDDAEQQIRDLLARQPRPTMPTEVEHRIRAALAAETVPAPPAERRGRPLTWLSAGVAAAVVVLAGVIIVPQLNQAPSPPPAPPTPTSEPPAVADPVNLDCPGRPLTYDSGTRYEQAGLKTQVAALVPQACSASTPATAVAPPSQPTMATMAPDVAERSLDCVLTVARTAKVVVLDRGSYEGTPAVVAVVGPPIRALALHCTKKRAEVLMDVALP